MKEIGSEFSAISSSVDYYFKNIGTGFFKPHWLRCGRDCLKLVADSLNESNKVVLFPTYCCDSMYKPFLQYGWRVEYYPINEDLTPNLSALKVKIERLCPSVVLLMDFFGFSSIENSIDLISSISKKIIIIEDVTHRIFNIDLNDKVSFYVGSIRKWMGINDGALLLSNIESCIQMPNVRFEESQFYNKRKVALELKSKYHHSACETYKQTYRKLLLEAEMSIENDKSYISISDDSKERLNATNFSEIKLFRSDNFNYLSKRIIDIAGVKLLDNSDRVIKNGIVPFSLPILVENRDIVQKYLADRGVYAPLLWPLKEESMLSCKVAKNMEERMLSLPIDQRYDFADMDVIYETLKNALA